MIARWRRAPAGSGDAAVAQRNLKPVAGGCYLTGAATVPVADSICLLNAAPEYVVLAVEIAEL